MYLYITFIIVAIIIIGLSFALINVKTRLKESELRYSVLKKEYLIEKQKNEFNKEQVERYSEDIKYLFSFIEKIVSTNPALLANGKIRKTLEIRSNSKILCRIKTTVKGNSKKVTHLGTLAYPIGNNKYILQSDLLKIVNSTDSLINKIELLPSLKVYTS